MDPRFNPLPHPVNTFEFEDQINLSSFEESLNHPLSYTDNYVAFGAPYNTSSPDVGNFAPSSNVSSEVDSPDDHDSDSLFKYLNQILMEENIEDKPSMFHDPLALKAAEKSFYEALGKSYPPSPYRTSDYVYHQLKSPDSIFWNSSEHSTSSSNTGTNSTDPQWVVDPGEFRLPVEGHPSEYNVQPLVQSNSERSRGSLNNFNNSNAHVDTLVNPNVFTDSESILQFRRGMEEASKFLPNLSQFVIDLDKYTLPPKMEEVSKEAVVKVEKDEKNHSPNGTKGRKHQYPEDSDHEDERSNKQSAIYVEEEVELSEMFDRVLLCTDKGTGCGDVKREMPSEVNMSSDQNGQAHGSNGGKTRAKKQATKNEAVDIRTLLISCAQSVAADDRRTANEQLKHIRQHSSPTGDAYQRLASVFADGLEARLAGTGTQQYAALAPKRITAAEKLKAYQVYLSSCPFKKISIFFANKMIFHTASNARTLHLIDFGITYGFQWPILIQLLSQIPGGPPKLRITGIDLPQPGFRPAESLEQTGSRLAKYCERFHVPFEYNAIATQNWENIKIEDLKLASGETVAVNCLFRLKNLLDETVVVDSPRDAVLSLIRKMNPDIFVQAVVNGSYSAPFFVTRFREALFHYSTLFDMFDATLPRDDQQRLHFEQEFYRREAMNVIACEGSERVERPETYKQWQVRYMRAGFKLLPLNQQLMQKLRCKVKGGYHRDFVFDEDGNWMLQGWKGRVVCASSCWVPA
ncbi:scarecrow-like protein 14 [Nicotiana tabacum]|uniref:Scarecrow-like protein 14 n=3 Tax=Nicotiana TaxID=4085 RepID=A0AC58RSF0_TOBAC|nr:PREDICTED: scarecrow-like protein 14 [Nicotiana sylvestris]